MNEGLRKLKQKWNDKPIEVLIVGALVITAIAKLTDAVSLAQGRRALATQRNIRNMQ